MFCGVWMSQSFSGFHFSVTAMRPSLRSLRLEGLARELGDLVPLVGDSGPKDIPFVGGKACEAVSNVISPLRTDVSTFTSAIRAPEELPTR